MTTNQTPPAANTVHTTVYSADGYKLNIVLAIDTVADIAQHLDDIRSLGLTPNIPGLEPGQEKETIAAVVRRASKKGTPIIDFYPHWQNEGRFGLHKYAHMYLDTPEQVAEFEAQSGLRLKDLPLYEGQQAIQREMGKPTRFETDVNRSFEIVRTPDGQHDTGMAKYIYSYATPPIVQIQAATAPTPRQTASTGANTPEPQKTAFSAPSNGNWWQNKEDIAYVKNAIGTTPGQAAARLQRAFADYTTPDDFIDAYRNATAVVNHDATPAATPSHIDDPLRGELLEITHVEPRMATGRTLVKQWIGHAKFEDEHGSTHPVQVLLFAEDRRQLEENGYDVSGWDASSEGQRYPNGITVTTYKDTVGRKLATAWNPVTNESVAIERAR